MKITTLHRWVEPSSTSRRYGWTRHVSGLLLALVLLASTTGQAAVTDPFTAHFEVNRGSLALGTTTFSLTAGKHEGCYVYSGRANPNALVRIFLGDVSDESRFCIDHSFIRPERFSHHIQGDPEKSYTLDFDWDAGEVAYKSEHGETATYDLGAALDPLSIHIAARRWVAESADPDNLGEADFPMVDDDGIHIYRLRASDGGTIDTPGGRFETLRVDRVGDNKRLTFWLARNADWIPVRVEQQKGDEGIFQMNLTSLERD